MISEGPILDPDAALEVLFLEGLDRLHHRVVDCCELLRLVSNSLGDSTRRYHALAHIAPGVIALRSLPHLLLERAEVRAPPAKGLEIECARDRGTDAGGIGQSDAAEHLPQPGFGILYLLESVTGLG